MYEHPSNLLLSWRAFLQRWFRHAGAALFILASSLGLGIISYRFLEGLSWLDSFLNAAMLLGGVDPVNTLQTFGGKLFAGFYALYAGIIFLAVAGLLSAPVTHRLLHTFHLES
jgi:hypothetical protein